MKKNKQISDLIALGEGYDESDDFIDNSEAVNISLLWLHGHMAAYLQQE